MENQWSSEKNNKLGASDFPMQAGLKKGGVKPLMSQPKTVSPAVVVIVVVVLLAIIIAIYWRFLAKPKEIVPAEPFKAKLMEMKAKMEMMKGKTMVPMKKGQVMPRPPG